MITPELNSLLKLTTFGNRKFTASIPGTTRSSLSKMALIFIGWVSAASLQDFSVVIAPETSQVNE